MRKPSSPTIASRPAAAPPRTSTTIGRVIAILDLFEPHRLAISVDEIAAALDASPASAYRYASDLLTAGLLAKSAGRFRLGPKIIALEYLIRSFDPILRAADPLMQALSERTGHDVLLCNAYEETIINVAHVHGRRPISLTYTKGLPMPLFRGSQAHVVLAFMDRRKLKRVFMKHRFNPTVRADVALIGSDWTTFSGTLKAVRLSGHYVSRGELDPGVTGIAAPFLASDGSILGSLVLGVSTRKRIPNEKPLIDLVMTSADALSRRVAQLEDEKSPALAVQNRERLIEP